MNGDGVGDLEFKKDDRVEFLPPDWEKYSQFGEDTDGGNYASYYEPVVFHKADGTDEYYIASWSSCELGENVAVILGDDGHLAVVKEKELRDDDVVLYRPWHPDFSLRGPMPKEKLDFSMSALKKAADKELEAYEEWKRNFYD